MRISSRWTILAMSGLLAACSQVPVPPTTTASPPITATEPRPTPTLEPLPVTTEPALPDPPFKWLATLQNSTIIEEWSPDGQWLVYSTPLRVFMVNVATGETCSPIDLSKRTDNDL